MNRALQIYRKVHRLLTFKRQGEQDIAKTTTKRKKFSGSYTDVLNLPSGGTQSPALQDPATGKLVHLMDYDPWP